jgi:single-strand DNA-binding protein
LRATGSGIAVCTFTLAVDRRFANRDSQTREADFIPVVVWGKAAELVGNSCKKGHRLLVEGRLQIRNFDAKDGTKHWVTEIIATNIEFIERREQPKDMANMGTDVTKDVPFDDFVPF